MSRITILLVSSLSSCAARTTSHLAQAAAEIRTGGAGLFAGRLPAEARSAHQVGVWALRPMSSRANDAERRNLKNATSTSSIGRRTNARTEATAAVRKQLINAKRRKNDEDAILDAPELSNEQVASLIARCKAGVVAPLLDNQNKAEIIPLEGPRHSTNALDARARLTRQLGMSRSWQRGGRSRAAGAAQGAGA